MLDMIDKTDNKVSRDAVIGWINDILDRKSWTATDLAIKASLSPSTILRFMNNHEYKFLPTLRTLQKISNASGYPIPAEVLSKMGNPSLPALRIQPRAGRSGPDLSPSEIEHGYAMATMPKAATVPLRMVTALPILLSSAGEGKAATVVAPPGLENDPTGIAFYMPNADLEPIIQQGSLMFGSKRRDPREKDLVLITRKNGRSIVRTIAAIDETGMMLDGGKSKDDHVHIDFDDIAEWAVVVFIQPV